MGKVIHRGLVPADDPMFTGEAMVFTPRSFRPSSPAVAPTKAATPAGQGRPGAGVAAPATNAPAAEPSRSPASSGLKAKTDRRGPSRGKR